MFRWLKKNKEVESPASAFGMIPYPFEAFVPTAGDEYKLPLFPIPPKTLYDVVYYSDVLRTIIKVITDETFRAGIYFEPRFKSKCMVCGAEYDVEVAFCEECGGEVRSPDYNDRLRLKEFVKNFENGYGEKFIQVLKQVDTDTQILDNGFLVILKDYYYTKNGKLFGWKVRDIVRGSPIRMRLMMSKYGMGMDNNGNYLYFCPAHRTNYYKKQKKGVYFCPVCGREMLPAWYVSYNKDGSTVVYGKDEVIHIKRWSNVPGYGFPPVLTVLTKVLTLMKMDRHMLKYYDLERSPRALLLIRGRQQEVMRAWLQVMQKARENPNMLIPLAVEGGDKTKKLAEYLDLSFTPEEMQFTEVREEFRRSIGALYGVLPLFQADLSVGGGLNNEGLQITVTNRTIAEGQRVWNEVLEKLSREIGARDYVIKLKPNEEKDMMAQIKREKARIENAIMMRDLGYEPVMFEGVDGIEFRFRRKDDDDKGGKTSISLRSLKEILHQTGEDKREGVSGEPEGAGKKAYNQEYVGQPKLEKEYTEDKIKVRVMRRDGVTQSYYVPKDKLKEYVERMEAQGKKVYIEGRGQVTSGEIEEGGLKDVYNEIVSLIDDIDTAVEKVYDIVSRVSDSDFAKGVAILYYIMRKALEGDEICRKYLESIVRDYKGMKVEDESREFEVLRLVITDDVLNEWENATMEWLKENVGEEIVIHDDMSERDKARYYLHIIVGKEDEYTVDTAVRYAKIGKAESEFQIERSVKSGIIGGYWLGSGDRVIYIGDTDFNVNVSDEWLEGIDKEKLVKELLISPYLSDEEKRILPSGQSE